MLRKLDTFEDTTIKYDNVLYYGYVGSFTGIDSIKIPLNKYCVIIGSSAFAHILRSDNAMPNSIFFAGHTNALIRFVGSDIWCDIFSINISDINYNNMNRPINYSKSYCNTEFGLHIDGYNNDTVNLHVVPDQFFVNGGDMNMFYDNTLKVVISDNISVLQRKKSFKFLLKIYNFLYKLIQKLTYFNYLPSNI